MKTKKNLKSQKTSKKSTKSLKSRVRKLKTGIKAGGLGASQASFCW